MSWMKTYESRVTTAEEAIQRGVKSGDRIFLTGNCSVPQVLLEALVARAPELENVEICHALTLGSSDYVAPDGRDGGYQNERRVYARKGEPCLTCGRPIRRTEVAQRGTHYCPGCQR